MRKLPVQMPLGGLNDDKPFSEQPPGTARDVQNMRAQDSRDKREKLSQRSGLTDITGATAAQVNGSNKVQHLCKVTYAQSNVDYAEISDANLVATSEWGNSYDKAKTTGVGVDRQGNTYWLAGRDILVKVNTAGEEVWRWTVPLKEETHVARGLRVDSFGNCYVSSDADQDLSDASFAKVDIEAVQENNRIWRVTGINNDEQVEEPRLTGEWEADGFIPDLYIRFGFVYYLQNRPDAFEADLVILSGFNPNELILSSQPFQTALRGVPYPANSLWVNSTGEVVVASEPFANRLENPKYPGLSKTTDLTRLPGFWTPYRNLDNGAGRIWSDYDPAQLGLSNGDAVNTLADVSGNGRSFFAGEANNVPNDSRTFSSPTYTERVLGDAPGVRFDSSNPDGMATAPNSSNDYRDRAASRTAWPSYGASSGVSPNKVTEETSAQFAYFIVARLPRIASKGAIIGQLSANADAPADPLYNYLPQGIVANRPQSTDVANAAEAGKLTWYEWVRETAGDYQSSFTPVGPLATNVRVPREADILGIRSGANDSADPEEPPVALITMVVDNLVDTASANNATTRAMFRVNGRPIDRWSGSIRISTERVTLGFIANRNPDTHGSSLGELDGDIVRMFCLARKDPTDATEPKVVSHQFTAAKNVQNNVLVGGASGGTFTLTVTYPDGTQETTGAIAWNATAAQVEAALEALPGLNAADVSTTGTSVDTLSPAGVQVIFGWNEGGAKPSDTGQYQGIDLPVMTADGALLTGSSPAVLVVKNIEIDDGLATFNASHVTSFGNDLEHVEGWLAHLYGIQHLLPGASEPFQHPFAVHPPLDPDQVDPTDLFSANAILSKYSTGDLSLQWVQTDEGGVGYGIIGDPDDNLMSIGPSQSSPADASEYLFITDNGDSVTLGASAAFTATGFQDRHPRMAVDSDGNFYIPRYSDAAAGTATVEVIDSTGASELVYDSSATENDIVPAYAVALPPSRPIFPADSTINRDEFLYIATDKTPVGGGAEDTDVSRKVRLISKTHNTNPPRETRTYAVAGGAIKLASASSYTDPGEEETGDRTMASAARYWSSVELFGKRYVTDGISGIRVIDPKAAPVATGSVSRLKASDGGEVPENPRLMFAWRGRLGYAHLEDRPHYWKMHAIGKPDRANEFPDVPYVGQPISGLNAPEAGEAGDIINTVVPWTDDILLFGGDHSLTALYGDPTRGGVTARGDLSQSIGQFMTVTDGTGMAFGKPWARDKRDFLFFLSSRGEAFVLRPGGKPEPISDRAIEKRLQGIDFSTHFVDAQWNWEDNCIHFFVLPFGASDTQDHYVFDVQRGRLAQASGVDPIMTGWWRDRFGHADVQPTAVTVIDDDDPSERTLLVGCADGRVRRWDPLARNDGLNGSSEAVKIDAYATIGMLAPAGSTSQFMFGGLEVELDSQRDGCEAEYFTTNRADTLEDPRPSFALAPGWNPPRYQRIRGNYCFLRLRNSVVNESFAVEKVALMGMEAGPKRRHSNR